MPRLAVCLLLLALSGCASAKTHVLERLLGDRIQGDADRVAVTGAAGATDALPLAIVHCTRFGRAAQFTRREGEKLVFACVSK
jgi:hypothetical protein